MTAIANKFIVISPCYNVLPYIDKCIESVVNQTYHNFEYIVVEDCSTDGTRKRVEQLQMEYGFYVQYNPQRTESPLGNFALGIELMPGHPEDILVTVDADDWLYDVNVLDYLNEVYQDPDVWLTYGQFVSASGNIKNTSAPLKSTRDYRKKTTWITSHLRTIKRKLWDKIDHADLKDKNGKYYVYYPDAAYMFPAIEMAGLKHIRFIDRILYVYNDQNPLCSADDWKKKDMSAIYEISKEIRNKKIYDEINNL